MDSTSKTKFVSKADLVEGIEKLESNVDLSTRHGQGLADAYFAVKKLIDSIEVKEVDNTPNIRFPHYEDIVEKVFGAGNLESFEYEEAEQLVSLAKEELLKDLEVKDDAFIKKACEWLKNSTDGYLTEKWGETELDRETLAADFEKYMKG